MWLVAEFLLFNSCTQNRNAQKVKVISWILLDYSILPYKCLPRWFWHGFLATGQTNPGRRVPLVPPAGSTSHPSLGMFGLARKSFSWFGISECPRRFFSKYWCHLQYFQVRQISITFRHASFAHFRCSDFEQKTIPEIEFICFWLRVE